MSETKQELYSQIIVHKDHIKELKAQLDKERWISVEERLPKCEASGTSLYVHVTDGKRVRNSQYCSVGFDPWLDITYQSAKYITHWKDIILPPSPVTGANEDKEN